jgi:hypothetical protein
MAYRAAAGGWGADHFPGWALLFGVTLDQYGGFGTLPPSALERMAYEGTIYEFSNVSHVRDIDTGDGGGAGSSD